MHLEPWSLPSENVSEENIGNRALKVSWNVAHANMCTKHRLTHAIPKSCLRASSQRSSSCESPRLWLKLIYLTHFVWHKDSTKTRTLPRVNKTCIVSLYALSTIWMLSPGSSYTRMPATLIESHRDRSRYVRQMNRILSRGRSPVLSDFRVFLYTHTIDDVSLSM